MSYEQFATVKRIDSRANPLFKNLLSLVQSARQRRDQGLAWLEGVHLCQAYRDRHAGERALPALPGLKHIIVGASSWDHPEVRALMVDPARVCVLADPLFAALSDLAQGVAVAWVVAVAGVDPHAALSHGDWLALDRVQDPGNVGSMVRSAAAAGLRGIATTRGCAQLWSPKVLRASMGGIFSLDCAWDADEAIADAIGLGDTAGGAGAKEPACVYLTDVHRGADLWSVDLTAPGVWVFGHEGEGVRPNWLAAPRVRRVRIPQTAGAESLNVAAAAAVCLFEQQRQRRVSAVT